MKNTKREPVAKKSKFFDSVGSEAIPKGAKEASKTNGDVAGQANVVEEKSPKLGMWILICILLVSIGYNSWLFTYSEMDGLSALSITILEIFTLIIIANRFGVREVPVLLYQCLNAYGGSPTPPESFEKTKKPANIKPVNKKKHTKTSA